MKHIIHNNGNEYWGNKKSVHRNDGGPAVISLNGSESWCKNNQDHRENNPAYIQISGYEAWYEKGNRIPK